jgi:hypothetical protein
VSFSLAHLVRSLWVPLLAPFLPAPRRAHVARMRHRRDPCPTCGLVVAWTKDGKVHRRHKCRVQRAPVFIVDDTPDEIVHAVPAKPLVLEEGQIAIPKCNACRVGTPCGCTTV